MISRIYAFIRSASCSLGAVVSFILLVSVQTPLSAQLQWESTTIHQQLALGQEKANAEFSFENKGTYPVVIRSTSSSCGCTTAQLDRTTYYPGDKGTIVAQFDVGNRTGNRRNTVQVLTDDPVAPSTTLIFSVDIPTIVTITPRLVHWRVGENPAEKTVRVQINPEAEIKVKAIKVDNDLFEVSFLEGANPGEYTVQLAPADTKTPQRVIISLQTEPKVENQSNFSFYAYVR